MTPVKQRLKHDPENGVWGDCHRAAIATVLDLDIEDVPHFGDGGPGGEEFGRREAEFLRTQGLYPISIPYVGDNLRVILHTVEALNGADIVYLLGGTSRTGVNHTVVCRGDRITHDPSPRDAGITGPCSDGYYWLTFFGSLRAQGVEGPRCTGCNQPCPDNWTYCPACGAQGRYSGESAVGDVGGARP